MACLDTTVLLDLMGRGGTGAAGRAYGNIQAALARGETLCTTRFNVAELYVGVHRAADSAAEDKRVKAVLSACVILDFTDAAAMQYGRITAYLRSLGRPAGNMDVLIAATALAAGHSLVTRNTAHFAGIPGFQVESY